MRRESTKITPPARTGLQLKSLVTPEGELQISLARVSVPDPAADEVTLRVEAAPINRSDIGLLFGAADMATASVTGTAAGTVVTARIPSGAMKAMAGRVGQSMPVGNEGAGVVIAAGSSAAAQALLGETVAVLGGAMYAQYRTVKTDQCLVLPAGATPAEGASCFVNPLTALGMVETMRREGHTALAAAQEQVLGQDLAARDAGDVRDHALHFMDAVFGDEMLEVGGHGEGSGFSPRTSPTTKKSAGRTAAARCARYR